MKNIFKLGLITAIAALLLALPVAASAESRTQVVVVDQTPEASAYPNEVLTRPTPSIQAVPVAFNHYWGTVDLLPEGQETDDNSRMLPVNFNFSVKSIEITGPNSNLVYAKTWDLQHPIDWYTNPYSQYSNETGISFYSLGGAATVTVKVTNTKNEWGYFIVNVSPPAVSHLLGTVNLHPAKGASDTVEMELPVSFMYDVASFHPDGPYIWASQLKFTHNGTKVSFSTSFMSRTTMRWIFFNSKGQWGYYIINVEPIGYCLPPV
ncbi:hypothetical protein SAMN05216312_101394 [Cohnella sp. OV330]|uniref:hypothetical protein n=1 Tax=Cohnella sp. OV330 TaxID=1855288 RepID=UPI0008EDE321|nr:hypothetical protein [Cohnella sp. OV330]SFA77228.1 hypothetical protein SAMN05216312_101394 [Cohnella sp. OV330]